MPIETVVIKPAARSSILTAADAAYPLECCGVVLGRKDIESAVELPNVADDRARRFVVCPQGLLQSVGEARRRGLDVVGFFHSHPHGPPAPSEEDIAKAGTWPGYYQLIASRGADGWLLKLFQTGSGVWREHGLELS